MREPAAVMFTAIEAAPDTRSVCDRVADVLSESHREDTPVEFRLGLLQGALAIALPQLHRLEPTPARKRRAHRTTRRSRARA